MMQKPSSNFLVGVLVGLLVCLLVWYWQKSTRAEDGALAMLDRLKVAQSKIRQLQAELAGRHQAAVSETAVESAPASSQLATDDLQQVKGIGPVFADRLQQAGIQTYHKLAELTVERLADILNISPNRASRILAEARK